MKAAATGAMAEPESGSSGTSGASGASGASGRDGSGTGMRVGDRPILPLWLRGGVLALVLCAVAFALATGPVTRPDAGRTLGTHERGATIASRELRFVDVDGGVSVLDAADGSELERIDPGEDGFVRSVMRGLANERRVRGIGAEVPFRVSLVADGSLWLDDPATRREVVLSAFGADNAAAFARMLPATAPAAGGADVGGADVGDGNGDAPVVRPERRGS